MRVVMAFIHIGVPICALGLVGCAVFTPDAPKDLALVSVRSVRLSGNEEWARTATGSNLTTGVGVKGYELKFSTRSNLVDLAHSFDLYASTYPCTQTLDEQGFRSGLPTSEILRERTSVKALAWPALSGIVLKQDMPTSAEKPLEYTVYFTEASPESSTDNLCYMLTAAGVGASKVSNVLVISRDVILKAQ